MERKQNNLVSIGEAFGGRHFTRFDQVDQLAWARGAARVEENQARLAGVELLGSAHIRVEIQHKDPFLSGPGHDRGRTGRRE